MLGFFKQPAAYGQELWHVVCKAEIQEPGCSHLLHAEEMVTVQLIAVTTDLELQNVAHLKNVAQLKS